MNVLADGKAVAEMQVQNDSMIRKNIGLKLIIVLTTIAVGESHNLLYTPETSYLHIAMYSRPFFPYANARMTNRTS